MPKYIKIWFLSFLLISGLFFSFDAQAQCPMCKANVESSMKSGGRHTGLGLNSGIYILLVLPYALVGVIGGLWYFKSRKSAAAGVSKPMRISKS